MGKIGYLKISNLYKDIDILLFRECFSLEKLHGTSSHIGWKENRIRFFAGGEKHDKFIKLFDEERLVKLFKDNFLDANVVIYGEAIGGKQQGMSHTYGKELLFVAFDVRIDGNWLDVPNAEEVVKKFGLEFVHYVKIPTELEAIDKERDSPSEQARRVGIEEDKMREGVVLRPLMELTKNNGSRIIAKHKRDEFMETRTPREVDPTKLKIIEEANAIANEWVTENRMKNILSHIPEEDIRFENIGKIIKMFISDVYRESQGEIIQSNNADKAIGRKSAEMLKKYMMKI